jgi:phage tail sheath protein FI
MAYNDYVAETWYAPAGLNRGLLNVLSIIPVYTQGERDELYRNGVNPLQTFRGEGNVIWGQKTEQAKASALDRINVRRLLITIEKSLTVALRSFIFEPNSENTRFRVTAMIESFMDQLSAKGAFQAELGDKGYKVVCDNTNNTPAVIDANELHVDVFVKPSRAAEFIRLNTIITTTGANFNELTARGFNL